MKKIPVTDPRIEASLCNVHHDTHSPRAVESLYLRALLKIALNCRLPISVKYSITLFRHRDYISVKEMISVHSELGKFRSNGCPSLISVKLL
jgi:hypothetical protein